RGLQRQTLTVHWQGALGSAIPTVAGAQHTMLLLLLLLLLQAQLFRQAEQAILQGDTATATPLLLQLLQEPLLQPAAVQHAPAGATARAGAAVGSPTPAQQRKQQQQQVSQ